MDYKDIYNDLVNKTNGLTDYSGYYDVSSKGDLQIAEDILRDAYVNVERDGLNYTTEFDNGLPYRIKFSEPVLEEQVKYEPNKEISESYMNEAMIEKHDTLNPKLWDDNNELKPEVRQKVEEIVDKFKENLEDDEVKLDVKDICLIGSNASYNYNPTSDLDIHIICDPSVYNDEDLANKIYLAYKSLWNNKYDPTFDGIEVELYVEPYEVHANSKGIYSLNNGWLKEPEAEDIPEVDENEIAILAEPFEERYEKVMQGESIEDIDNLIDDIYLQRQESIMKDGEFADGNLVFKLLRSRGRIQDLRDRKVELENKEMSITEDNFNSNLESMLIEEGLVEDTIDNDFFNLEPGQVYRLGDNHIIKINDVKNDVVSCTETDGDETYDWEDAYFPVQSMLFEYDAKLEESINEDTVKQGDKWVNKGKEGTHGKFKTKKAADAQRKAMFANGYKEGLNEFLVDYDGRGMEFSFPDPKDTLAVYLDWEGIYGYNDDIIDFGSAGYDDLEAYLEEEGIYGYTQKIYDILNGEPAWCSGMNQEDFESICRANYIDPQSADDDVDIDDDIPSELPANADDEDYLDDRDESLKEDNNRDEVLVNAKFFIDAGLKNREEIEKHFPNIEFKSSNGPNICLVASGSKEDLDAMLDEIDTDRDFANSFELPGKKVSYSESLKEGYNRLSKKFDNIEDARKFAKFLDQDLEPRIEISDTEDENGNVVTSYEVLYWDQQDFHDDELDEAKKTGLVSAAKSALNRLCKKYKDASPEEIYNKALGVAGRSEYPFVKNNLEAKKDAAIEFIKTVREAEWNPETDESLKENKDDNHDPEDDEPRTLPPNADDDDYLEDPDEYDEFDESLNESKGKDLIFDRDTGSREVKQGINKIAFFTDNYEDAVRWNRQLDAAIAGDFINGEPSDDPKYFDPENYPGMIQEIPEDRRDNPEQRYAFWRDRTILNDLPDTEFVDKDYDIFREGPPSDWQENKATSYPYTFTEDINGKSLNESADRHVERGINWTWFYTDSEDDANKWFFELMGVKPNKNTIDGPVERNHPGKFDSYWSFRMRNDLVDQLDFNINSVKNEALEDEIDWDKLHDAYEFAMNVESEGQDFYAHDIEKFGEKFGFDFNTADKIMKRIRMGLDYKDFFKKENPLTHDEMDFGFLDEAKCLGSCDDKKQIKDEKKKGLVKKDKKSKYDIKADESLNEGLTSNDITLDQIKALPVGTIMGIDVLEDPNDPLFKDRDNYFEYRKLEDGWHIFADGEEYFDGEPSDDYTVFMALTNLNAPRVYSIDIKESTNEDLRDELINHGANEVDTLGSMGSKNGGSVSLFYNKPKELYYVIEGPVEKKPAYEFARNNFYNLAPDTMEALKKHPEYIRFTSKDKGEAIKFIKDNYNSGWVIGENLNEEVNPEDPKAQALALYLDITTDAIDNGYSNGIYEIDNEEYFVGTEEEAHDMAVGEVKMSYDDMGLDAFTPRFQEWILDNAIDEGSIDEFVDNEIDYFTNEEPDQNMVDYLEGLTDKAQYVRDTLGSDTFKDWAKDKIDLDKVAEEAISEDGVAHFIAYYDGNEIDLGDGLYAYRLN